MYNYHVLVTIEKYLLIIPGVLYLIYWIFVPQVVVLKDVSFGEALSYSKTIVSGRWRKVFFYLDGIHSNSCT